jgi:hypothetical protein
MLYNAFRCSAKCELQSDRHPRSSSMRLPHDPALGNADSVTIGAREDSAAKVEYTSEISLASLHMQTRPVDANCSPWSF